eukprot:357859-Chlamydomonas_euryale.AAC.5
MHGVHAAMLQPHGMHGRSAGGSVGCRAHVQHAHARMLPCMCGMHFSSCRRVAARQIAKHKLSVGRRAHIHGVLNRGAHRCPPGCTRAAHGSRHHAANHVLDAPCFACSRTCVRCTSWKSRSATGWPAQSSKPCWSSACEYGCGMLRCQHLARSCHLELCRLRCSLVRYPVREQQLKSAVIGSFKPDLHTRSPVVLQPTMRPARSQALSSGMRDVADRTGMLEDLSVPVNLLRCGDTPRLERAAVAPRVRTWKDAHAFGHAGRAPWFDAGTFALGRGRVAGPLHLRVVQGLCSRQPGIQRESRGGVDIPERATGAAGSTTARGDGAIQVRPACATRERAVHVACLVGDLSKRQTGKA